MASSYLLKKARERAEEVDKKHGEDSYGGTKWLESQKQKTAEKKNEVTTETGGRTAGSVASNYLRDKAKAQQLRVSREYGTGAYGGIGNADRDGYTDFVRAASELRLDPNRYARTEKEEEADVTDTEKEKSPWWDIALESAKYGWSTWNRNLFSTLDAVTPEFTIGGKTIDPFSTISDLYTSENERYRQQMEDSLYGRSQAARIAAEIGAGTIAAVPDALLAVMTSGASAFPELGKPASGFLNSARTALTNLAKNPNYWSSFLQTYGSDYEEMKALGASNFKATSAALISSLLNAGIEVGGGIETLPARLKNGNRNQILQWALSLPEEGLEEVFQDIVTNVTKKGLVDPDKKWFSMNTEDDAVINPIELAKDFGMGTAVGALLGGAQVGTVSALNAGANAANTKRVSDLGSKYQVHATKTIEEGLSFPENTQAYKTAKEVSDMLSRDGQVSDYDLGRVVIATEQAIRAEENASDTVIGADAQEGDTETQETLSRLAMETVAEKAGTSQEAVQSKSEGIADSGRKTNIPYNVLADKQESSKPSVRRESMAEWTGYGENGVRAFNAALERDGSVTPEQMRVRFQSAYEAGLANVPKESVVQSLSDDVMTDAYLAGRKDYVASLQKAPAVSTAGKDSGFDSTGAPKDVSKWEVETVDTLLRSLGVKGSWTNDDRYNARIKGSSIEFSTTFQRNVGGEKRSIVFYAAHEAGMHRLMQLAPTEGRAFINELYRYIGKDRPSTLETLAEEKQAAYKEQNVSLSTEGAMEEISADSIMSLYKNEEEFRSAIEKVANGKNETAKKGLARFREILSDIVEKLRNAISRLTGKDRAEAQKTLDEVEHLRSLYETALRAAVSKNRELESSYTDKRDGKLFRSRDANGTVTLETSVGNPVAQMQENGSAQLSLKTYREFGRAELSKWLEKRKKSGLISNEDASDILTNLDEYYELCQNFKNKYAPFGAWSDAGVVTDAKGKPVFSVIKKNGEYAMNLDFSLVCKKRRTLDAVFGEMIRRGLMDNVDLGEADISRINDIIRESGFETACALCFVDAKRYRQAGVADTFVNKYNDIVRMMLPEDGSVSAHHFDFVGTGNFRDSGTGLHTLTNAQLKDGISKLRGVMRENGSATVPYKIAKHLIENPQDRRLVSRGEFMNTDGFEAVKLKNPSILRLYNSSKGAGGPKASFSDVQYLGDVMKKSGFTPEKAYAVGGVRIQSFSDYVPRLVFDYIQMTGDLAAKNLPAHAYTKEAMFAKQFGMTGVKINLSLVPAVAENGVAPGLDANGDYLWYDGQSFGSDVNVKGSGKTGFDSAVEIQNAKGYDKNCGTIAVGISDEQIRKMLDDPDIRMIIPYHKSSLNPIVAAMNKIDRYKDYTDTQNTRRKDTGTKITGKEFNFNEALRRTGDAKAATNEYLAWCEKNGYIPKFEQFSGHENYYKLLEDFSTYDSSGASSPQAAVTMTFPTDADAFGSMASLIEQGLEEDAILEARRGKGVPEIVDKIEKVLKKKEEYADNSKRAEKDRVEVSDANTQYSLKDSTGKSLSDDQEKYFRLSSVRDRDGLLVPVYHATSRDFTVFDRKKLGENTDGFASSIYTEASSHVGFFFNTQDLSKDEQSIYDRSVKCYLNIENPYDTYDLNGFANAIEEHGEGEDASEIGASFAKWLDENGYDGVSFYDNEFGGTTYVALYPEQIKNVDNKRPSLDPDINLSKKAENALIRENEKLKEVNRALREQFKVTRFAKVDKKSLDKFARSLLKEYNSTADVEDTRDALDALYTYMANGEDKNPPVWEDLFRSAYDVAESILTNASVTDTELYDEYKGLRDYLRTTGISIDKQYASDIQGYENLSEFRRANFGRIKIVNDGLPVDTAYQELSSMYPEFFDEDKTLNPADQLSRIAEVLDTLKPMEINPYNSDMRRSATWVANDILDRFFNLPQAKPTYAYKAAKKLAETKYLDRVKLENLRAEKNAKIAELIDENRKKVKEARKEGMRKRDEAVKLLQDRYNAKQEELSEARRASALQEKIERHARQLSQKLLNPTDKQHIPEVLRKPVAKVLDAINMESAYTIDPKTGKRNRNKDGDPVTRTLAFADLRAAYQKIMQEDGSDIVVDPEMSYMLDLVIKMRDVKLSNMMPSQLEAVWNVVRSLEHTISLSGKILSTMKYAKTVDLANAMVESTETRRVMRGRDIEDIRLALENPYTFFSHYGEAGKEIYRMLRNAQDEQQIMTNDVRDKVEKIVDEKTASNLEREVHEFKTERGDSLVLTKAHIMDIYLLSRREQAQAHLMQGGIVQPEVKTRNIKRGTDSILLSLDDIQDIISTMTEKERKIADSLQELTQTTLAEYGNSASLKAYGYKKFTGEDYWPIKSAKEGVHSNVEKGADNTRSIKNIGLAKSVVIGANNPLDIGGVFNTFASHASDMIDYAAWLCPMEDANRLYNFRFKDDSGSYNGKSIKGILNRYGGKNADKYWHRLMEDIQNGIKPVSDNAISQKVGRMIGNARGAAVGANIRVIIQQPTAIIRASMVLSPVDMVAGLVGGGGWKTALKHSAIAQRKDAGGFDMSSPAQMKSTLFGGDTKLQKFNEAMMAGASAADAVTWGRIWNACENAVKRKKRNLAPKSKEFYEAVDELFTEVIDQTQVVDGVLQRSQAMRSGDTWLNQATAFMGEPTMSLNMLLRAYENFAGEKDAKKRGAAMRKFGRAAFALIATNTVNALAQSLVDAWRDDDDDEYWNKFWKAFTGLDGSEESAWEKAMAAVLSGNFGSGLNPAGYIPVAKDLLSLVQGYDVSRADADIMSDIINASKKFSESLKDGKTTVARASFDLSKQVAKVFGISLPNIERDITGIMRQIAFETGNVAAQYEMEKWSYKIGNEKNKSRFEDILYKAYSEDRAAYDHIRSDLLRNGFTGDELDAAINARKEKSALSGTGYESAKEAYDALYSMKQSGRTDSYDQLRRTLLEASYTDIDGRNERLFTEKNIESAMQTRRVNEGIQSMGYSSKDGVYDAMYESIRNDDMTEYYKKVVSMMGLGVDASDIESAMRTRAKADGLSVSDLTKALASGGFKPKFETESADTFDIDDLSTDEYTTYSGEYGDMIDRLMDDFAKRGFDALSPEDANKWLGSAYSYAKETALEIATDGEYDSDTKWINDAQQAEKNGISVSDYIITKDEYGSSVADKLYDAKKNGISVDQYQEYRDMLDKYDEPNENGNLGSYTSAERVKAISAVDGLGDREIAFLWDTDQGYEALSYGIDMNKYIQFKAAQENIKADKDKNGNSISGSRREKIEDYLNSMGLSYKEYLYLLGTEYSTVKKNKDYIEYFG